MNLITDRMRQEQAELNHKYARANFGYRPPETFKPKPIKCHECGRTVPAGVEIVTLEDHSGWTVEVVLCEACLRHALVLIKETT